MGGERSAVRDDGMVKDVYVMHVDGNGEGAGSGDQNLSHDSDRFTSHGNDRLTSHDNDRNSLPSSMHSMDSVNSNAIPDNHSTDSTDKDSKHAVTDNSVDHTPSQEIHSPLTGIAPPSDVEQGAVL